MSTASDLVEGVDRGMFDLSGRVALVMPGGHERGKGVSVA